MGWKQTFQKKMKAAGMGNDIAAAKWKLPAWAATLSAPEAERRRM